MVYHYYSSFYQEKNKKQKHYHHNTIQENIKKRGGKGVKEKIRKKNFDINTNDIFWGQQQLPMKAKAVFNREVCKRKVNVGPS